MFTKSQLTTDENNTKACESLRRMLATHAKAINVFLDGITDVNVETAEGILARAGTLSQNDKKTRGTLKQVCDNTIDAIRDVREAARQSLIRSGNIESAESAAMKSKVYTKLIVTMQAFQAAYQEYKITIEEAKQHVAA